MSDYAALQAHLDRLGRVVLGFSGGVDSSLLAVAALHALGPDRFLAVLGRSPSVPQAQRAAAAQFAAQHGVPLLEIDTEELADPHYAANPENRCYFCKRELWARLGVLAAERGFDVVIDGTHAEDLREHRPGARAADERGVRSPLAELGWTKQQIRDRSQALGLVTWDQPSAPCLASRIRYGLPVTVERLAQVEAGELAVRAVGVRGDLRVRHHGEGAVVEVLATERALVEAHWPQLERQLQAIGFGDVQLDPRGYRRGALLPVHQQLS